MSKHTRFYFSAARRSCRPTAAARGRRRLETMMARADRLIREAEGKYERSKAHELQGKGNATGKLVEGELPDDAAERKALMDQALAIGARSA